MKVTAIKAIVPPPPLTGVVLEFSAKEVQLLWSLLYRGFWSKAMKYASPEAKFYTALKAHLLQEGLKIK